MSLPKMAIKWIPTDPKDFIEFVSVSNTNDLNLFNHIINIVNMSQSTLNELSKTINREFLIREYLGTFPPSPYMVKYITELDSEQNLKQYFEGKDPTLKQINEYKKQKQIEKAKAIKKLSELNDKLEELGLEILK